MAPGYLVDVCRPVSSIDSHKHPRSANRGQLQVPPIRMSTYGRRAFRHAGPSTWKNALSKILKCSTAEHTLLSYFWTPSKTLFFRSTSTSNALEVITVSALHKLLTYLFTHTDNKFVSEIAQMWYQYAYFTGVARRWILVLAKCHHAFNPET